VASRISPYLLYEDGASAMDFIRDAFGFEEVLRSHSPEGRMWHGELRLGDDNVFVGEPGGDYRNPKRLGLTTVAIHVYVDDVDAHCDHARGAGAEIADEPSDQVYGDRRYTAKDPEGHHWTFATRVREVAPEEWGAEVAT
jgi:PhnB protein